MVNEMATKINLNVFHPNTNQRRFVIGTRQNIKEEIRRAFKLRGLFTMYQKSFGGKWTSVTAATVKDCVEVRIRLPEEQESVIEVEHEEVCKELAFRDNLKKKLSNNETLTGKDREYMCELIKRTSSLPSYGVNGHVPQEPPPPPPVQAKRRRVSESSASSTETVVILPTMQDKQIQTDITMPDLSNLKERLKTLCKRPRTEAVIQEILQIMNYTYQERRNFILDSSPLVKSVKEYYPVLFGNKEELLAEFGRITTVSILSIFYKSLDAHSGAVINLAQRNSLRSLIKDSAKSKKSEDEKKYIKFAGCLLLLPTLVNENIQDAVQFNSEEPRTDYPVITCDCDVEDVLLMEPVFKVYAEKHFLGETMDFNEAVLLLMAAHYCFNMQYPDYFSNSAKLIGKLLLLTSEEDVPQSVEKLYSKLLKGKQA